jgi:penicillin-binding protein 1A
MTGGQTPAEIWKAFMSQALATTPARNFDGSAAGKNDAVGELEDDEKTAVKQKPSELKKEPEKEKAAEPKKNEEQKPPQQDKPQPKSEQPKPEPVTDAPERGGGVGKGR